MANDPTDSAHRSPSLFFLLSSPVPSLANPFLYSFTPDRAPFLLYCPQGAEDPYLASLAAMGDAKGAPKQTAAQMLAAAEAAKPPPAPSPAKAGGGGGGGGPASPVSPGGGAQDFTNGAPPLSHTRLNFSSFAGPRTVLHVRLGTRAIAMPPLLPLCPFTHHTPRV